VSEKKSNQIFRLIEHRMRFTLAGGITTSKQFHQASNAGSLLARLLGVGDD
jgi:deoxyribose-phosphate aldolase